LIPRLLARLLVCDGSGNREWETYHCILPDKFVNTTSVLSTGLYTWGLDYQSAGLSCGKVYYLTGNARGKITLGHNHWVHLSVDKLVFNRINFFVDTSCLYIISWKLL